MFGWRTTTKMFGLARYSVLAMVGRDHIPAAIGACLGSHLGGAFRSNKVLGAAVEELFHGQVTTAFLSVDSDMFDFTRIRRRSIAAKRGDPAARDQSAAA